MKRCWLCVQYCALVGLCTVLTGGGCIVTFLPPDHDGSDGDTDQTIRIRLINATNTDLDPQFYVSAEPVSAEDLFKEANKYTDFGVMGLGVLGAGDVASFSLPCDQARVIGTQGGLFGKDRDNPEGVGQRRVFAQDLTVFCGESVTLTYRRQGDGFATIPSLGS